MSFSVIIVKVRIILRKIGFIISNVTCGVDSIMVGYHSECEIKLIHFPLIVSDLPWLNLKIIYLADKYQVFVPK